MKVGSTQIYAYNNGLITNYEFRKIKAIISKVCEFVETSLKIHLKSDFVKLSNYTRIALFSVSTKLMTKTKAKQNY